MGLRDNKRLGPTYIDLDYKIASLSGDSDMTSLDLESKITSQDLDNEVISLNSARDTSILNKIF